MAALSNEDDPPGMTAAMCQVPLPALYPRPQVGHQALTLPGLGQRWAQPQGPFIAQRRKGQGEAARGLAVSGTPPPPASHGP